jgi:hypothetical protein
MDIDDWVYEIVCACGLSTADSDVNVIGLHRIIKELSSVKELTDQEIHDLIINKVTDYDMIKQALRKANKNGN